MSETSERLVDVRLVGGPPGFPEAQRHLRIDRARAGEKIKIEFYGGHQHFVPSTEEDAPEPRIFRWSGTTKIAE